ncbi:MAG: aspartate--tRNA(Asn) ligase [Clostridia bacterium]|nr:aspartate--tRNA(Asn) ligase [Clostridia bacterium]
MPTYTTIPAPAAAGSSARVRGMIQKIRTMSGFAFVLLAVGRQTLQCVWSPEAEFPLETLGEQMAVEFEGTVVADPRSRAGVELHLRRTRVLSAPAAPPPVVISGKTVPASLDTLLDYRSVTLRNAAERAIFTIQAELCAGFREFFAAEGFTEIHTPKLVSGSAEGGANVFALDYFGQPAFLAQSPQVYKQAMVGVFGRVYEIAPVFRAEHHDTARHINEYTSVDCEVGFIDGIADLMALETAMLRHTLARLADTCPEALAQLKVELPAVGEIPVIPFAEAKALVAETCRRPITDPHDFDPEEERLLCRLMQERTGSEFVFVTRYPSAKRPFYTMDSHDDPTVTESFDLLFRGLEITTGGQRIHDYAAQVAKMQARGMDTAPFASYLMAHRHGLPPHGGMGIGLERLTARLCGFNNVRRAALFPRDVKRIAP